MLFPEQIQNTDPHYLLRRKLTLCQTKSAQRPNTLHFLSSLKLHHWTVEQKRLDHSKHKFSLITHWRSSLTPCQTLKGYQINALFCLHKLTGTEFLGLLEAIRTRFQTGYFRKTSVGQKKTFALLWVGKTLLSPNFRDYLPFSDAPITF